MCRSFFFVAVLLFSCSSGLVLAQTGSTKTKSQTELNDRPQLQRTATTAATPTIDQLEAAKEFYRKGTELFEAGELLPAAESFRQAIQLDPNFADAYSSLGRTYFKLRDWQRAADNLKWAAALHSRERDAKEITPENASAQKTDDKVAPPASKTLASQTMVQLPTPSPNVRPANQPLKIGNQATSSTQMTQLTATPSSKPTTAPEPKYSLPTKTKETVATAVTQPKLNPTSTIIVDREPTLASNVDVKAPSPLPMKSPTESPLITTSEGNGVKTEPNTGNGSGSKTVTETMPPPVIEPKVSAAEQTAVGTRVSQPLTPAAAVKEIVPAEVSPNRIAETPLTKIYRVGPSDVLDVRISNTPGVQSTLYTVSPGGLLEHPLFSEPMAVSGLTVEEIGNKIEKDLMARAIVENPKAVVGVRDYASHSILISGLVKDAGTKFLRREGIPLYVVVADAQPLPEAARVTVIRVDNRPYEVDLDQTDEMNFLVRSGDVITLSPHTTQFVYIGGEIRLPGEKTFRRGLTLLQVVLASGGLSSKAKYADIARVDDKGVLVPTRFQLREIVYGKSVDPILKPGDRISISR